MKTKHIKRYIFLVVLISLCFNTLHSQNSDFVEYRQNWDKQFVYWGYYIGVGVNDFRISYTKKNDIQTDPNIGFNLGLIGDMRLHKNINLRLEPGLISNTRKIYYNKIRTENDSVRKTSSTYLHVPLLVKFSTDRYYNIRPYVIGGAAYDYNFSSKQSNSRDNSEGVFRMKRHNFTYELGVGIDIYFPYFIFSPSIRGIFAINNELVRDKADNGSGYSPWTTPINYLGTRGIFLKLAFH